MLSSITRWAVDTSVDYLTSLGYLILLGVMIAVELSLPRAAPRSAETARFNIFYTVIMLALVAALRPLAMIVPLSLTAALGGGWISFPPGAVGWCCGFVALLLLRDLLEYLWHRAQHTFPLLWRMHELHHSAEHFDVTLSQRHFWLEPLLRMALLYPLLGLLLKPPVGAVLVVIGICQVFGSYLPHMNFRFSPKLALLVNHPQYHRVHHSRSMQDYNRNLCSLLPLWDVVFGTLRRPLPDEFVEVGLEGCDPPRSLWQALYWPWRRRERQALATTGQAEQAL